MPAHVGIHNNERADEAARKICEETDIVQPMIPRRDLKIYIKQVIKDTWNRQWNNMHGNKLLEIKPDIYPLPNTCFSDRFWERTLSRLRIGHCTITHSYLMNGDDPPYCDDCIVPLTVKHILTVSHLQR